MPLLLSLMDELLAGMWNCPASTLDQESAIPPGEAHCDWSIYDKTEMWWRGECGWQWRMAEQIMVYRLWSRSSSGDARLYCAEVKRLTSPGAAISHPSFFPPPYSRPQKSDRVNTGRLSPADALVNLKIQSDRTRPKTDRESVLLTSACLSACSKP